MTTMDKAPELCDRLAELLPEALDDPGLFDGEGARHMDQFLRCQAEGARYRRLSRTLIGLRSVPSGPIDPHFLNELLEGLHGEAERRQRQWSNGRRAASFVGLAAATAAGVGGVLALANRRRSA